MAKIRITQVRSTIGRTKKQEATLESLGLRGIGKSVEHEEMPNILGMIKKVSHLVSVETI
ncbi:MAG TPA: 50S ribosomal protein L30 [Flavobacteriaceae bacterium]|nr:50S ribosomal protein L30 [Flavobacteriaceae bacterium]